MNNAELFKKVFGIYAEEFWAYPKDKMLDWLAYDVPERNVGKWIKVGDNSYRCSVCNEISCCNGNFCPDCGADMRKEIEWT